MMKLVSVLKEHCKIQTFLIIIIAPLVSSCQKQIPNRFEVFTSDFDRMVKKHLKFNVPTLTVDDIRPQHPYLLLDCRSSEEFTTSTIKGAFNTPDLESATEHLLPYSKDTPIIVFCSIGYRSEKMTKALIQLGYKNANNLYGSIFEWANRDLPLHRKSQLTDTIHTYNRRWGKWVKNKQLTKIW